MDVERRQFLVAGAMTVAAVGLHTSSTPHELAAIDRATEWLFSPRLTAASRSGKVVLVEFCTYTCVNWLRTMPYVRAWSQKYRERLLVIGVHTPEFPFERDVENVQRALGRMNVDFPIVLDNDYAIWRAFDNHYWPALYFMDLQGRVRHHHFGEGEYEQSERVIQQLVASAGATAIDQRLVSVEPSGIELQADWTDLRSQETYLRSDTVEELGRPWSLSGKWTIGSGSVTSTAPNARVTYRFHARDVNLVMGPSHRNQAIRFRVTIDGRAPDSAHGLDVDDNGNGVVAEPRTYQLIRQPKPIVDRAFAIEFLDAGAEVFDFTFG